MKRREILKSLTILPFAYGTAIPWYAAKAGAPLTKRGLFAKLELRTLLMRPGTIQL